MFREAGGVFELAFMEGEEVVVGDEGFAQGFPGGEVG